MSEALESLDRLTQELRNALEAEEWQRLGELNGKVAETVDPVMGELERGELQADLVQQRLQTLQEFCDLADTRAKAARKEAEKALKTVNQNNSAARAYRNVSSGSRK